MKIAIILLISGIKAVSIKSKFVAGLTENDLDQESITFSSVNYVLDSAHPV